MVLERVWKALLAVAGVAIAGMLLVQLGVVATPMTEDRTEVRIVDETGESKAVIDAEVAASPGERYTGLSDHDSLDSGTGMLFVHDDEDERTYVMREMAFGIDIVFIDADREITAIHHAPAPGPDEDGSDHRYTGDAKWVLEVPLGETSESGIECGDEVEIALEDG